MKRILTISIIMINLLNLFGCKAQNENDPYWEFDKTEHFRPELNKGEFFKLSGFDFGWFVLEPLSKFIKDKEHEIERGKSLSYGQKALYYWWYLDAQVTNGGFVQFYYNGYGPYVPTIIKGLEHIGDTEMANLVKKADKIYQKNKKLMDKAQESDLFGSDLYDRLDEMSLLDDKYYEMNEKTMSLIESYIRKNPNEICLDEDGKEFDMTFTGLCKTFYADKTVKEEFQLEQGVINGEFKSFYENGKLKEKIDYKKGEQTGERKEFYDSGKLKYQITKEPSKNILIHKWYFENGNPKKLESKLIEKNERIGEYKEWHENEQLAQSGTYKSAYEREGEWLEFYENGDKKVEAEFINGDFILKNHWNKKGEQTLTNGTGLYVYEYSMFGDKVDRNEQEYMNFKRHGKQKTFTNGVLTLYQEMQNGKENGITRRYYDNGNLEQETVYENGTSISTKEFPKFKNPKVKTSVISRICDGCYEDYEQYKVPDNKPMLINDQEIAKKFKAEISIFEGYGDDHIMSYGYYLFVDEKGNVNDIKFAVADNMWLDEEVKASMAELKFEPALKDGKTIKSIHYVRYKLELTE
jgi:antitoxin component YwqK of YwqJK toxin-antitoxin module